MGHPQEGSSNLFRRQYSCDCSILNTVFSVPKLNPEQFLLLTKNLSRRKERKHPFIAPGFALSSSLSWLNSPSQCSDSPRSLLAAWSAVPLLEASCPLEPAAGFSLLSRPHVHLAKGQQVIPAAATQQILAGSEPNSLHQPS